MPPDALKGFVAVSSGTLVPAWISCDTETPLGEIFCTGFLSERIFIYRQGIWGEERAEREELVCSAITYMFESSQNVKFLWACKREHRHKQAFSNFLIAKVKNRKIMGLVGA